MRLNRYFPTACLLLFALAGCQSAPVPSGFLSDYAQMAKGRLQGVHFSESVHFSQYDSAVVDPVDISRMDPKSDGDLKHRRDLADYMQKEICKEMKYYFLHTALNKKDLPAGSKPIVIQLSLTQVHKYAKFMAFEGRVIDGSTGIELLSFIDRHKPPLQDLRENYYSVKHGLSFFSAMYRLYAFIDLWVDAVGDLIHEGW